tara:strand:+ start:845 stop:1183 length:339 start_codon:yes stop_codon:yes gene_type:complete
MGSQMQRAGGGISGTVTTLEDSPSTLVNGQNTVAAAGTAEALAGSTSILGVTIKALRTNTGNIYVGDSSVDSTNGFVLRRGSSVFLAFDNLADIYIDADTSGEGVSYIAVEI